MLGIHLTEWHKMKMKTMVRLTLANSISFFFDDDWKAGGCEPRNDDEYRPPESWSTTERPFKVKRLRTIRRTNGPRPMKTKFIQMQ